MSQTPPPPALALNQHAVPVSFEESSKNGSRVKTDRTCPVCQKSFSKSEHLLRHVRCHTKERPFQCGVCGKSYSRNDTLLRHGRSHAMTRTRPVNPVAKTAPERRRGTQPGAPNNDLLSNMVDQSICEAPQGTLRSAHQIPDTTPDATGLTRLQHSESVSCGDNLDVSVPQPLPNSAAARSQHDGSALSYDSDFGLDFWQLDQDPAGASWLLAEDFDVTALDTALTATLTEWAHVPMYSQQQPPTPLSAPALPTLPLNPVFPPELSATSGIAASIEFGHPSDTPASKRWFTHLKSEVASRAASEGPVEQFQVDEHYRDNLSRKLRPRTYDDALPSVNHLNLCLRLYFTRFHPIFPVVHVPTFRSNSQNALLLLSMCSIGSLFVGSANAAAQGAEIFERLNKAILASWETHLSRMKTEALSMIQAALLGQTFGMLSGRSNDLVMVDAFQGTLLSWARRFGGAKAEIPAVPSESLSAAALNQLWKEWAYAQQQIRLTLALHIHDAEMASLFHHEPLLRHNLNKWTSFTSDALFRAPSATKWMTLMRDQNSKSQPTQHASLQMWMSGYEHTQNTITQAISNSKFTSYSVLESINASIIEARQSRSIDQVETQRLTDGLILWYKQDRRHSPAQKSDLFDLRVLWHSCFISLYSDLALLECFIGRDGHQEAKRSSEEVRTWALSPNAVRCLFHSLLLQEQVEAMRLGAEPSLHVPRSLFSAGLVWLCCSRFLSVALNHISNTEILEFPEMKIVEGTSLNHLAELSGIITNHVSGKNSSVVYGFIDLLQKVGRWGISGTFASILTGAIHDKDDT